jgi:hypothetical protein
VPERKGWTEGNKEQRIDNNGHVMPTSLTKMCGRKLGVPFYLTTSSIKFFLPGRRSSENDVDHHTESPISGRNVDGSGGDEKKTKQRGEATK